MKKIYGIVFVCMLLLSSVALALDDDVKFGRLKARIKGNNLFVSGTLYSDTDGSINMYCKHEEQTYFLGVLDYHVSNSAKGRIATFNTKILNVDCKRYDLFWINAFGSDVKEVEITKKHSKSRSVVVPVIVPPVEPPVEPPELSDAEKELLECKAKALDWYNKHLDNKNADKEYSKKLDKCEKDYDKAINLPN
jgi:hypothetical protein